MDLAAAGAIVASFNHPRSITIAPSLRSWPYTKRLDAIIAYIDCNARRAVPTGTGCLGLAGEGKPD